MNTCVAHNVPIRSTVTVSSPGDQAMTSSGVVCNSISISALNATVSKDGTGQGNWLKIMPSGTFNGRTGGRGPFVSGNIAEMGAIVSRSLNRAGATEIVVDYDHQTIFSAIPGVGGRAAAAGWMKEFDVRPDGIWARIEWTATAAEAIRSSEYRYLSPTFYAPESKGKVQFFISAALTNTPDLDLSVVAASAFLPKETEYDMKSIAKALGLPETATEEQILAAITSIQAAQAVAASATPDPSQYVPMADFTRVVQEANSLRQGVTLSSATAHVEEHIRAGKLVPYMKDWAISLCTVNKPEFDKFITTTGPAFNYLLREQLPQAFSQKRGGDGKLDESEEAVRNTLGLTQEQFIAARDNAGNAAE
jgi:phage I-like protein